MIGVRQFRMAYRFAVYRFREFHPYDVQALLLNACNLKCVYCRCPEIKTKLMTTEQWRGIIRHLGRLGTMRIKFQGGEPTLRTDFRELCAEAHRAGIHTAVITNGIRVAEQPDLLDGLDEVVVSLDSATPAIHDALRGQGSHAQAMRAIELSRQRGLPTYAVMVVSRSNLSEMDAVLRFCEAHGVTLHAQPVLFGREFFDGTARHLALSADEIRTMHDRLAQWKRQGRALVFSARTYQGVVDWPDHTQLTTRSDGPSACMAGKFYVHIEPNGDVWPCAQHGSSVPPKNILRDGLEEALRSAQQHDCGDCFSAYLNERKDVFHLRPAALLEVVRRE